MTQQQEQQLRLQAQVRGYDAETTERFIQFAKQKEQESQKPASQPQPQRQAGEGFLKSLVKGIANPFLRLGATAESLKTAKIFGGPGADLRPTQLPFFGQVKPITNPRDVASVGGELALDAIGGPVAGKIAKPVIKGAVKGFKALAGSADTAVSKAPQIASRAIENLTSTVDEGTKTALNPLRKIPNKALDKLSSQKLTSAAETRTQKFERYLKQAHKAVSDYTQETPLEMAGKRAEEALKILNNKLTKHGQLKSTSLGKVGNIQVSNLSEVRNSLRDKLLERTGTGISAKGELVSIPGRQISIPDADIPLVEKVVGRLQKLGNKPTLREVDDTVDYIQSELYKRQGVGAIPVDNKVTSALKEVTGQLNSRVKKIAGKSYRTANDKYAYLIDTRDKLNKALGSEATKGGALMKKVFSPTDGGTKQLFAEIKRLTGIDLTEEATLAKFVMEKVGDARQANLLEQLQLLKPKGALGWIETIGNKLLEKARDPIKEARQILNEGKMP